MLIYALSLSHTLDKPSQLIKGQNNQLCVGELFRKRK